MKKFKKYNRLEFVKNNFIKFPNWLQYLEVSSNTKLVYMYILDRYQLSLKNKWIDDDNNIFCYFTRKTLAKKIGISDRTVISSMNELEKLGLLITIHQYNSPSRIYLLEPTDEFLNDLISKKENDVVDELDDFKNENVENIEVDDGEKFSPLDIDDENISPQPIDGEKISLLIVKNFHPNQTNNNQTNNIYNYPSFNKELTKKNPEGMNDIFNKFNLDIISDENEQRSILQIIKYLNRINRNGITVKGIYYENIEKYVEMINLDDIRKINIRLLSAKKIKSIDKYLFTTLLDYIESKEYMTKTKNDRENYQNSNNNFKSENNYNLPPKNSLAASDNRMTREEREEFIRRKLKQKLPIKQKEKV